MAGAILPDRTLAQMNDKNFLAMKTAKGQLKEALALAADLREAVSALTKENGDLKRQTVDILLSKDDELGLMAARCTALADQLEQAQKTLALTSRALNDMIAERDAARDWAKAWKMAASKWFGRLAELDKAATWFRSAPEAEAKP